MFFCDWFFKFAFLSFFLNVFWRHVILPKTLAKSLKKGHLMSEEEWRRLGVMQSRGWEHYLYHKPGFLMAVTRSHNISTEPHVLLFRRKLTPETRPWEGTVLLIGEGFTFIAQYFLRVILNSEIFFMMAIVGHHATSRKQPININAHTHMHTYKLTYIHTQYSVWLLLSVARTNILQMHGLKMELHGHHRCGYMSLMAHIKHIKQRRPVVHTECNGLHSKVGVVVSGNWRATRTGHQTSSIST